LNNIACCNFQMGQHEEALQTLQEARNIVRDWTITANKADLDLLHVAITQCNYAYLLLRAKRYEEARSIFEEALLVSTILARFCDQFLLLEGMSLLTPCDRLFFILSFRSNNPSWETTIVQ
jgi:tetratricopeptide (TPR) repeat protein